VIAEEFDKALKLVRQALAECELMCFQKLGCTLQHVLADLHLLPSEPQALEGDWYTDFGIFKLCGSGEYPRAVLKK